MSMFKQLVKLRDNLSSKLEANLNALNMIATGSGIVAENTFPVSGDRTLVISNSMMTLYNDQDNEIDEIDYASVSDLNTYIAGSDEKWADLVDELSNGANTYQLLGDLTSRYSYCNRVSFADVSAYVNSYDVSDKATMVNGLFSSADENGYVSRNSFLSLLDQWMSKAKEAVERDSYDVDRTNPYGLEAVTSIIVSAVGTAISVVCTVLSGFFGVVIALVGTIISLLFNAIGAVREFATLRIDNEASNLYVKGPIACDDNCGQFILDTPYRNHVWLRESNGVAIFSWPVSFKNPNGNRKVNAYLYPCWRAHDFIQYFIGENSISIDTVHEKITFAAIDRWADAWKDPYRSSLKYSDEDVLQDNPLKVGASLLIGFAVQCITGARHVYASSDLGSLWWSYGSQAESDDFGEVIKAIARLCKSTYDNSFFEDEAGWLSHNASIISTGVNALANHIKNFIIPNRGSIEGSSPLYNNKLVTIMDNTHGHFPRLNAPILGSGSGASSLDDHTLLIYPGVGVSSYDLGIATDTLPTDFGVILPQYDDSALSHILTSVAIIATVAAVAGTQLKKAIVKRKYAKQALRAHRLEEARDAYLADPTNTQLRNAYSNEVYRYNKLGKWFGWGTYDPTNGWVDAATATESDAIDTTSYTDQTKLLNSIKNLIR